MHAPAKFYLQKSILKNLSYNYVSFGLLYITPKSKVYKYIDIRNN